MSSNNAVQIVLINLMAISVLQVNDAVNLTLREAGMELHMLTACV